MKRKTAEGIVIALGICLLAVIADIAGITDISQESSKQAKAAKSKAHGDYAKKVDKGVIFAETSKDTYYLCEKLRHRPGVRVVTVTARVHGQDYQWIKSSGLPCMPLGPNI